MITKGYSMKTFLSFILFFAFIFSTYAFEALNNSASIGLFSRINCASDIKCTGNLRTGILNMTGIGGLETQTSFSSTTTLTVANCGTTYTNSSTAQINLPEASTGNGCRITFVTGTGMLITINPDDADQILIETNAAGDSITNTTEGNSIILEAISDSTWAPLSSIGTWTDAN